MNGLLLPFKDSVPSASGQQRKRWQSTSLQVVPTGVRAAGSLTPASGLFTMQASRFEVYSGGTPNETLTVDAQPLLWGVGEEVSGGKEKSRRALRLLSGRRGHLLEWGRTIGEEEQIPATGKPFIL